MHRSEWDFEQYARHAEREAMAAAEHSRLIAAARRGATAGHGRNLGALLRAFGERVDAWVSGSPVSGAPRSAAPVPCRERAV